MPFITKQRFAELELKESQFEYLRYKCREQQIELEIRKRNHFNRENMIVHEEVEVGRKVCEFTTILKTIAEDESLAKYLEDSPFISKFSWQQS